MEEWMSETILEAGTIKVTGDAIQFTPVTGCTEPLDWDRAFGGQFSRRGNSCPESGEEFTRKNLSYLRFSG
jgi:hypothetical protein